MFEYDLGLMYVTAPVSSTNRTSSLERYPLSARTMPTGASTSFRRYGKRMTPEFIPSVMAIENAAPLSSNAAWSLTKSFDLSVRWDGHRSKILVPTLMEASGVLR